MTKLILDILAERAITEPQRDAYVYLKNGETVSERLTYGKLDQQARAIASILRQWQGERALLLYQSGLEFISAFFGCLYAGVIAVPAYPPRRNQSMARLLAIAQDAQATVALTTTPLLTDLKQQDSNEPYLPSLNWIATDTICADLQASVLNIGSTNGHHPFEIDLLPPPEKDTLDLIHPNPDDLAFLQYTSGSTGTPKGVMITHANLMHNQQAIQQATGNHANSIYVSWLPLFHDMGLGNMLEACFVGIPFIFMSPTTFLKKPIRWLQAISTHRATITGAPGFAYDLCVRHVKPEQLTTIDLSSLEVAANGAEPINAETIEMFSQIFAQCGFQRRAFYPCYGMAESTLLVTGSTNDQQPVIETFMAESLEHHLVVKSDSSESQSRTLVGCGHPYLNTRLLIVDPKSFTQCPTGTVGEIWVSSDSVASGYWNRPKATQETFHACLNDTGEGPFLRTGDLGFFLGGELFVTGRIKDILIIRGQNHYPQDIERTVQKSHPALRQDCGVAFSLTINTEERLVIVQEIHRQHVRQLDIQEVIGNICEAVVAQHGVQVYQTLLVKPGSILKTSSGKVQRQACKAAFLTDTLKALNERAIAS